MKTKVRFCIKPLSAAFLIIFAVGCNDHKKDIGADVQVAIDDSVKKRILPVMVTIRSDKFLKGNGLDSPVIEYSLSISTVTIPPALGKVIIEAVTTSLTLNGSPVSHSVAELELSDLNAFRTWANAITCTVNCGDWMTGMRIIYGQEGSSVFLYYQPVMLCAVGGTYMLNGKKVCDFNLCNQGDIYFYNGDFEKVDAQDEINDKNRRISNYTRRNTGGEYGVEIRNPYTGVFEGFKVTNDDDATANVKQVMYPVDELIDLAKKAGMSGKVKLWNAVVKMDFDGVYYHKHNIELSSYSITTDGASLNIPPGAKFLNLSHICPPRCSGNKFTIHIL